MSAAKILIVNGNPQLRAKLKAEVLRQGLEVDAFRSATEAMAHVKAGKYGAALVDQFMSPVSGPAFSSMLRKIDPTIRITLLTPVQTACAVDVPWCNRITKDTPVENIVQYLKGQTNAV